MSVGSVTVRELAPPCICGEGPHWEEETQSLLYVDIPGSTVHRFFPSSGRHQQLTIETAFTGPDVAFVLPIATAPHLLLLGHGRDLVAVKWGSGAPDLSSMRPLILSSVEQGLETRFNDAKCDPHGRVWAGTMGLESEPGVLEKFQGSLYCFSSNASPTVWLSKVSVSNGLTWSQDNKTFYFIDSFEYKVEAFDYNGAKGKIDNRRTVFDYKRHGLVPDLPDGMTIDVDGNLWVANFVGSKVICINPTTGQLVRTITMPVQDITSVCWGGPDYSTLYVTSSKKGFSPSQLQENPQSGCVFEVTGLGTRGFPAVAAALDQAIIKKIDAHFDDEQTSTSQEY